ncbi:hypothetical protein VIN01S_34990 [Vibrio inusitatus NBRC 102082]|uniref:DUF3179 domain-containing protein n=1 Tax=Vibrio inusitatus NBRC 102082 TaxID=1219070 RepID=A0A4Y3I0C9_9VIBR|nr:DUF3179 domain-containing (seleno)protein [Vibrio inusitatus]GEA52695.1 hypothetical protein VIN01S_34990 [Vibrio inusitatus NBRC 102082]
MEVFLIILALVSLLIGAYGSVALTEAGQIINLPRDWVFGYFKHKRKLSIAIAILAAVVVFSAVSNSLFTPIGLTLYALAVVACLFFINIFAPIMWLRTQQYGAKFMSVAEAESRLADDTDVFVLEIDGDARAYPRDSMQVPHIVGDKVGGKETVMSYCALSNLPVAFNPNINGKDTDLKVIAQVNNNLIFTDTKTGELYQQVTATGEYSKTELEQYPVQRMTWGAFKALYPEGKVFDYKPNALDKLTLKLFDNALKDHYAGKPLFPTLNMNDKRLDSSVKIWGVVDGNEAVAAHPESFSETSKIQTEINGKSVLFVHFESYQTVGAFWVDHSRDWTNAEISVYGECEGEKLPRAKLFSGMPWMVWSHWFPHGSILKG